MKKMIYKKLFCCLIVFSFYTFLQAQSENNPLEDTYWKITLDEGVGVILAHYTNDTVFLADDLEDTFDPHTKYRISGDTMFRQYTVSLFCEDTIIGQYNYSIIDGVMRFQLIEDDCPVREEDLPLLIHTRLAYTKPVSKSDSLNFFTIDTISNSNSIFRWTNNSWVFERPEYHLYDIYGNIIETGIIHEAGVISIPQYEDGVYFITIFWRFGTETFKLFKLTTTSILEPGAPSNYTIYPNPSPTGIFTYDNQSPHLQVPYRLYSMDGRLVRSDYLATQGTIDISTEAAGIYYLIVEDPDGAEVLKLVK